MWMNGWVGAHADGGWAASWVGDGAGSRRYTRPRLPTTTTLHTGAWTPRCRWRCAATGRRASGARRHLRAASTPCLRPPPARAAAAPRGRRRQAAPAACRVGAALGCLRPPLMKRRLGSSSSSSRHPSRPRVRGASVSGRRANAAAKRRRARAAAAASCASCSGLPCKMREALAGKTHTARSN